MNISDRDHFQASCELWGGLLRARATPPGAEIFAAHFGCLGISIRCTVFEILETLFRFPEEELFLLCMGIKLHRWGIKKSKTAVIYSECPSLSLKLKTAGRHIVAKGKNLSYAWFPSEDKILRLQRLGS